MPAQTDWDKVLDRYEALCNQCIDLKLRAESGEKVSGAEFSRLIGNLNNLRKLLREDSGSMSPAQRSRFSRIRDRYSNVFGKGSRTKVRVNADEASVSGSGEVSHAENRTGKQAQAGYGLAGSHGENSKYAGERSDSGYGAVNQGVERSVLHGTGGVQLGTTGDIYAKDDYGADAVNEYDKGADAVQALIAGKIDCVIIDNEPAKAFVKANKGLKILDSAYAEEQYAICFKKGNTELQTKVNNALKELIADGTVKNIVNKYIKAE